MHGTFSVLGTQRWRWQGWFRSPVRWHRHEQEAGGRRMLCWETHQARYTGLRVWKDAPPASSLLPPLKFSTWHLSMPVVRATDAAGRD